MPDDRDVAREPDGLCARYGESIISAELCLSWDELKSFAADPLVTIGAHTVSHCNLAKRSEEQALQEIAFSRRAVVHLAYPYGDRGAAGPREFAMTGFNTAVTTRPGMIFRENAEHPTALHFPQLKLSDCPRPSGADVGRRHHPVEWIPSRRRHLRQRCAHCE